MPPNKIHARNEKGQPICGAKTRAPDRHPCKGRPMANGRCRLHGGKTPHGPESPHWKDGKHSKYLPQGIMERYNQLRTNPDYIALQDEITLVDVRINTLLSSIEHKGSGIQIRRLKIEFDRMRLGLKLNNAVMANEAVITMQNVFDEALAEMFAWEEITRLIELRRRLSSTEQERIVQAQAILTSEEVMAFVGRLSAVLRANVKDDRALSVIAGEIRNLTHAVDPNRALLEANV